MFGIGYLEFAIAVVPVIFISYAAYWAVNIRKALAVPIYRTQALGVFTVSIALICYIVTFALWNDLGYQNYWQTNIDVFFSYGLPPVVAFYWLDASVRTARRSDPLLRSFFHWQKLRLILWAWVLGASFPLDAFLVLSTVTGPTSSNSGPPPLPLFIFILSPIFMVGILGLVVLPRAAKFTGDKKFGRHLLWFGISLFLILFPLISIFFPLPTTPLSLYVLAFAIPQTIGGYCLYRSVTFLAPMKERSVVIGNR